TFSEPDEVVIDDIFAKDRHLDVGSMLTLKNQTFRVSGIVENGKGARVFMDLKRAQEFKNAPGRATVFFIKLKDSSHIDAAIERMKIDTPGYELRNVPEYEELMNGANIPGFNAFNEVVVFVALCIGV